MTESPYADRIAAFAAGARRARKRLEAVSDETSAGVAVDERTIVEVIADGLPEGDTIPANREEAALVAARDGLGPVVALYVEARTADEWVWFSETEMDRLHAATSDWLAVYARCHGVDVDPDVTVREAAEMLLDTHDITDVAALLTGIHRSGASDA